MMEGLSSMMTSAASAASNAQSAISAAAASPTTALTPAAEGGDTGVGVVVKKMAHGIVVDAVAAHGPANGKLLKGDTMKMVLSDSQCDPKAAVDAGNKVVNVEQVVAIVGPSCSGATNAMVQSVTIPAGVVNVSDSATAPSITDLKDNALVFRVAPSDA